MNKIKKIIFIFFCLILASCVNIKTSKIDTKVEKKYFTSKGFALIYSEEQYKEGIVNKKLKDDGLFVMHSYLKKNTPIKIINPSNEKIIETKILKNANYPKIYNIVISKKIARYLDLNPDNPYIEVLEYKKNRTFVAKKSKTFDEEKYVAEKAPVNEIQMDILTNAGTEVKKKTSDKSSIFVIVISDFYYLETANNLKKHLQKETKFKNFYVNKINKNKYRLSIGPFENFNSLKSSYISLNKLGFDELEIEQKK